MIVLSEFEYQYKLLMSEMRDRINEPENEREIIEDGVMDAKKYFENEIRLAWMLKEAYDEVDGKGGGWKYHDMFKTGDLYKKFSEGHKTTWHPMIYISYSIHKNFPNWSELPWIRDKQEMCEIVKETAFINCQKLPAKGLTSTHFSDLWESIDKNSDLLIRQIDLLAPNVLVFANTFNLYKSILKLENVELKKNGSVEYCEYNGKLYVSTYHPAQRKISRENYVNDIVLTVKNWWASQ